IRTSARTTTNARPAPAGRSPTTSANSAPSASRSPSAASPNPDQADQAAPRPPDHPPITGGPRAGSAGAAARPAKVPFSGQIYVNVISGSEPDLGGRVADPGDQGRDHRFGVGADAPEGVGGKRALELQAEVDQADMRGGDAADVDRSPVCVEGAELAQ